MKAIIELSLIILMLVISAGELPTLIQKVKRGQLTLLKESSSSRWGKAWVPVNK